MTKVRCLRVRPLPVSRSDMSSLSYDRVYMPTALVKIRGSVKVPYESGCCDRWYNSGTNCHPKGLAICEAVTEAMLNTKGSHGYNVDNVCLTVSALNTTHKQRKRTLTHQRYDTKDGHGPGPLFKKSCYQAYISYDRACKAYSKSSVEDNRICSRLNNFVILGADIPSLCEAWNSKQSARNTTIR